MSEKQILVLQIWNLDESGFLTDGGRCKVLAPKGGREGVPNKITLGGSRLWEYHSVGCFQCLTL